MKFTNWIDCLAKEPQDCLHLHSVLCKHVLHMWLFMWVLGIRTQVFTLAHRIRLPMEPAPSRYLLFSKQFAQATQLHGGWIHICLFIWDSRTPTQPGKAFNESCLSNIAYRWWKVFYVTEMDIFKDFIFFLFYRVSLFHLGVFSHRIKTSNRCFIKLVLSFALEIKMLHTSTLICMCVSLCVSDFLCMCVHKCTCLCVYLSLCV